MDTRALGKVGPRVPALGLGCMGMSDLYGPADRAESLATIHAALDAGITLLDTGDLYGMGLDSRGLLSGHWSKERAVTPSDIRGYLSWFGGANLERNLALVETLPALAREKETTVAALATAWVLSRGEDVVPLVSARRRDRLVESLGALDLRLTADDLARIEAAVPRRAAAGDRYPTPLMAHLDSERRSG